MSGRTRAGVAAAVIAGLTLGACARMGAAGVGADPGKIAETVKADVARLVADYNAHDAAKVAGHDAPDVVQMSHGAPNTVGAAADLAANRKSFADDPAQHIADSDGTVDVAASGDRAVYRSTYVFTSRSPDKKAITEKGNYLAGYRRQPDGTWKIAWSVVSDTGPLAPPN